MTLEFQPIIIPSIRCEFSCSSHLSLANMTGPMNDDRFYSAKRKSSFLNLHAFCYGALKKFPEILVFQNLTLLFLLLVSFLSS